MKKLFTVSLVLITLAVCASCSNSGHGRDTSEETIYYPIPTTTASHTDTTETPEIVLTGPLTSPTQTAETPRLPSLPPANEAEATRIYREEKDGLLLEVRVDGYIDGASYGELYHKLRAPIPMTVTITNEGDVPIYQWLPALCHGSHHHDLSMSFKESGGRKLTDLSDIMIDCPTMIQIWCLDVGESYTWQIEWLAGECTESPEEIDVPVLPSDIYGIRLYEEEICESGSLVFSGTVKFPFSYESNPQKNTETISVPLTVTVYDFS